MKSVIREPQQERSIEKKNKIIQAGYELFSEAGYHGTNTVEIAKRAGVSTGIVYGYFQDKRDIMISVLQIYIDNAYMPVLDIMKSAGAPLDIEAVVPQVIDKTLEMHEQNAKLHNTLHSLATTDETVNATFIALEDKITENISEQLKENGVTLPNIKERVHLAMNIVQSFAHEYVFDNHPYIDYGAMRETVCRTIINLFK
ncbi:MAG: TetR/AcrR family transcriptional regulator [Corallococcus sp.]|nr:TetR/AcrR family transcriptional regulator [Corallococcus sp.]MCM1358928.1 TetR/AcrR family transcriptional regulator [Corallococcus sp.]MCM1394916.1 TetR/AcrR family transcriptional regulator [Corallococcus sp.]